MSFNRCTLFLCEGSNEVYAWTGLTRWYFSFNYWDTFLSTLGWGYSQWFKGEEEKEKRKENPRRLGNTVILTYTLCSSCIWQILVIHTTRLYIVHLLQQKIFFLIVYFLFLMSDTVNDKWDTRGKTTTCFLFLGSSTVRSEAERLNKGQQWSQRKDQGRC